MVLEWHRDQCIAQFLYWAATTQFVLKIIGWADNITDEERELYDHFSMELHDYSAPSIYDGPTSPCFDAKELLNRNPYLSLLQSILRLRRSYPQLSKFIEIVDPTSYCAPLPNFLPWFPSRHTLYTTRRWAEHLIIDPSGMIYLIRWAISRSLPHPTSLPGRRRLLVVAPVLFLAPSPITGQPFTNDLSVLLPDHNFQDEFSLFLPLYHLLESILPYPFSARDFMGAFGFKLVCNLFDRTTVAEHTLSHCIYATAGLQTFLKQGDLYRQLQVEILYVELKALTETLNKGLTDFRFGTTYLNLVKGSLDQTECATNYHKTSTTSVEITFHGETRYTKKWDDEKMLFNAATLFFKLRETEELPLLFPTKEKLNMCRFPGLQFLSQQPYILAVQEQNVNYPSLYYKMEHPLGGTMGYPCYEFETLMDCIYPLPCAVQPLTDSQQFLAPLLFASPDPGNYWHY